MKHVEAIDAIVAVSDAAARQLRDRLDHPEWLHVVHNGTVFPPVPQMDGQPDDLLFLGGSQPLKGKDDVRAVWEALVEWWVHGRLHWYLHWYGRLDDRT